MWPPPQRYFHTTGVTPADTASSGPRDALFRQLHRADEQLDAVEREQPLVARAAWAVSSVAAQVAAHPSVQAAARATASASAEVVRVAAPVGAAVGKGAVQLAWQVRSSVVARSASITMPCPPDTRMCLHCFVIGPCHEPGAGTAAR